MVGGASTDWVATGNLQPDAELIAVWAPAAAAVLPELDGGTAYGLPDALCCSVKQLGVKLQGGAGVGDGAGGAAAV